MVGVGTPTPRAESARPETGPPRRARPSGAWDYYVRRSEEVPTSFVRFDDRQNFIHLSESPLLAAAKKKNNEKRTSSAARMIHRVRPPSSVRR